MLTSSAHSDLTSVTVLGFNNPRSSESTSTLSTSLSTFTLQSAVSSSKFPHPPPRSGPNATLDAPIHTYQDAARPNHMVESPCAADSTGADGTLGPSVSHPEASHSSLDTIWEESSQGAGAIDNDER